MQCHGVRTLAAVSVADFGLTRHAVTELTTQRRLGGAARART